jgi:colanic acid/amylovoran biosynthesis protein
MAQPLRIGLLWHSLTSGNLGIGALTLANMAIVRGVAQGLGHDVTFIVMGMRDDASARPGGTDPHDPAIESFAITTRSLLAPGGFWRTVGTVDCVLDIGAGDSFADIYGPKRFAFLWLTKLLTILRGVPLLLSPQTIGPFTRTGYRTLAGFVMRRARAVVARDAQSLAAIHDMAPAARALLSVDVAFELPFESQAAQRGGTRLRIGLNVSGLLYREAETGRNRFGLSYDYAEFTRKLITRLHDRGDCDLFLITHATSGGDPEDDDGARADRLAAAFPGLIRVPDFPGPCEAKSMISSLDFLVAGRMHACIGAFSAGTPIVPVAYSRKFSGLFDMLDYHALVPVTGMDTGAAVDFVIDALDRRDALAVTMRAGMGTVRQWLDIYRDELRALLTGCAARGPRQ